MKSSNFQNQIDAIKGNDVWDLIPLSECAKCTICKQIFKTKRDLKDHVNRYKARLVVKGFIQKERIDYTAERHYVKRSKKYDLQTQSWNMVAEFY